ncbi:MAG TPA: hypothetical protein GX000_06190 [Actinomyces sp.]|nr:hypothetical protein [Actinomyces sp.]
MMRHDPASVAAAVARLDAALAAQRRASDRLQIEAAYLRTLLAKDAEPDPLSDTLAQLREACAARGLRVTHDEYLPERDAAELLGRAPGTLRGWRAEGRAPEYRRRLGRVEYALTALAEFTTENSAERC